MRALASLLLCLTYSLSFGQLDNPEYRKSVAEFIQIIKQKNKAELAKRVNYPFNMAYPIPDIKDERAFVKRFDEVFDAALIKEIINSKPATDWSAVGWRGIMLHNGTLWLDHDGTLRAVNHQTAAERQKSVELIKLDKASVHPSIKTFESPVCLLETNKYRIRIDYLGKDNYRYTSWPKSAKMSDKPDIIIEKGEAHISGTMAIPTYRFKNKEYIYECAYSEEGDEDSPRMYLTIFKNEKQIAKYPVTIIGD